MDTTTATYATSREVLERFLASYWTTRTRDNYRFILTRWLDSYHKHRLDPVGGVHAAALEPSSPSSRLPGTPRTPSSVGSAFYRWCVREELAVRTRWS